MTSQFPTVIFQARETENIPGIVYNVYDKQNMFSEDFQNLGTEITAIENWLQRYYVFTALLEQSGSGDVSIIEIENTFGFSFEFIRSDTGVFRFRNTFLQGASKSCFYFHISLPYGDQGAVRALLYYDGRDSRIVLNTFDVNGNLADGCLSGDSGNKLTSIEIRYYKTP